MREEYVDSCYGASTSWRAWVHSSTKNISSRTRSAALVIAILVFLWIKGSAFVHEPCSEDDVQRVKSIDYSISTAVPTHAGATNQTNMRQSLETFHNKNNSHLQQFQEQLIRLCAQKLSGESSQIMLIIGSDQAEGRYAVSCVDNILFSPRILEPQTPYSLALKFFGALIFVLAAYFAVPYPPTANGESDQHFARAATSASCPPLKIFNRQNGYATLRSCPFSEASADDLSTPSSKTSQMVSPSAAHAASNARKPNVDTPTLDQWQAMSDEDVVTKALENSLALYTLEKTLGDSTRAVQIRRAMVARNPRTHSTTSKLETSGLPFTNYDFDRVYGACCENVIGYLPLPVGVAGPLDINGSSFYLPMATTEGVLVASTNRGATAINASGGVTTTLLDDGMTRGPALRFSGLQRAAAFKHWLDTPQGYDVVENAFNSTSRFAKLRGVRVTVTGSDVFARFKATTGDAMGMNMISKGVDAALCAIASAGFDDMQVVSLSGNYCTDKKAAAVNWIDGRGKSVCAQAIIAADVLCRVLKTDVDTLVDLNTSKNLVGSAVAGAMGGFNAHAANIVTAIFLATGQDPAQNVESSGCLTAMKK